ncbi:Potassium-transporting ATPase KdpC subunit OS=Tsukamurella paurometabola (strain ATCC 8368 / DSM/ CCUG 35730 / CIP 100753 / JCM 10117 / KCTC 9821 / NBRC 16120 / NCIMB 702349 / NCTC 13040) OX=521096 GN=kdpC PE=3 SV=1 [Tsukamurella paurometabola]|uniref:Potassium-transporting ATPase KdpC subunit n=1 Tax=Tsukamurella paurometabola (strain ATCC 8368 / DSM 20162 / CCUG 35730 / CIP 100753 / JCM 10117 / KCTC 9821 / NBRC 16120 / NCIMB 702349 / NCTC 13040) TaxID=521096 RepID=D5UVP9_TSUPD|nr:potassium-transporting ATPase subunit KdpC [Tsukamurella paurometabola]ADG79831.1 potassium-transporting ATPase, C subunit [Tsukamurella paurometabola DSM 20162]SUP37366.1 potassium-transporting ATPase subunit C [Tsukamurella paurometabola]
MNDVFSTAPRQLLAGLRMFAVLTVILGGIFPLVIWGVGQVAFSNAANGSQIERDGQVVGSKLLAQEFDGPQWFHARPSASDYDTTATGGSNLGPFSDKLVAQIEERRARIAAEDSVPGNPVAPAEVPADAVTASFSGVDPYISPAYARQQVARVAQARNLSAERVTALVGEHTQGRQLGYLGQERVNVVTLNLALSSK